MVENQSNLYHFSYFDVAIFGPSKMELQVFFENWKFKFDKNDFQRNE